jgi:hypothetical protein
MTALCPWHFFDEGRSIGTRGSENGTILLDEEHDLGARITLERGGHCPYSITCGVYGTMVHTRFFDSEEQARAQCEAMKPGLVAILEALPLATDLEPDFGPSTAEVERFLQRFP